MDYKEFESIVSTLREQGEVLSKLYDSKIHIIEFIDPYQQVIATLMKELYGTTGYDWFSWFCYENNFSESVGAWDENGAPICYDVKSLYDFLEKQKTELCQK
jgi:hypothetical protein